MTKQFIKAIIGFFKMIVGWLFTALLWIWFFVPRAIDWVGRTTLPDDWAQLTTEKLPNWSAWIFSTPWWVAAILATVMTVWMMWASFPGHRNSTSATPHRHPVTTLEDETKNLEQIVEPIKKFEKFGLYVGQMFVSTERLVDEGWITITARCFNATNNTISLHRALGKMNANSIINGKTAPIGNLPPVRVVESVDPTTYISNFENFEICFEQRVPRGIRSFISNIRKNLEIQFDLTDLNVLMLSEDGKMTARLPLWDGIRLWGTAKSLRVNRAYILKVEPVQLKISINSL